MDHSTHILLIRSARLPRARHFRPIFGILLAGILLSALLLGSPDAQAQVYAEQNLYSLGTNPGDGAFSHGGLTNVNGIFYGTTSGGLGFGTIFSFDPATNTEKTLYTFGGSAGADGSDSAAGMTYDPGTGMLFGTTFIGGTGPDSGGDGTVFSFDPVTHAEKAFYSFKGMAHANGAKPDAGLIDVNGTLYGTTEFGGTNNYGSVFSVNAATHVLKTLYSFNGGGTDGDYPRADLTYDSTTGKLYGTTQYGGNGYGTYGSGTVFSVDPTSGAEIVLYRFMNSGGDGQQPFAGLCDVNGTLYGTTDLGGAENYGSVFSIKTDGTGYQQVISFQGSDNSSPQYPLTDLIYDPGTRLLFGTSLQGGDNNNGTVFSVDPTGVGGGVIYRFQGGTSDGINPEAALLDVNGKLYGMTFQGGTQGAGIIFSLTLESPIAANDTYAPKYQTAYAVHAPGVLGNDNASGHGPLTATLVSTVGHGTLTFNADGSFLYTPAAGFVGTDSFTYYDTNSVSTGNTATVILNVQATVPVAHIDSYAPKYNTTYSVRNPGVLANDYNGDNVAMTSTLVSSVAHGTLTFHSDGSFIYKPNLGFAGTDTFTYKATNPIGTSNTATVSLIVAAIAPIAYSDTYAPRYATAYAVHAPGVLGNDDTGGSPPITAALVSTVSHGSLTFNSDGSFTYTPGAGFVGTDSFTYKDTNAVGTGNTATVTLKVTATAPIAGNDAYTVKHNTTFAVTAPGVLANDYNGDNQPMTAALVSNVSHGTLTLNSNGSFSYTPNSGFSGTDTFTYHAVNPIGTSNTATVTLTVQ